MMWSNMGDDVPSHWILISVLFSNRPLSSSLANDLYLVARTLHDSDEAVGEIKGELVNGTVQNLKQRTVVGSIGGPIFEASLDTDQGHTNVRFLLTKQGLELPRPAPPKSLMN
jgi:hypothetical protein